MATTYRPPYEDALDDVASRLAASRLSQRLSRDSATLGSIRSVRSSRIEKPRSNQNSPQGVQRRRTASLTPANTLHRPLPDAFQAQQYGVALTQPYQPKPTPRPVTWHPALFQQSQQFATGYAHVGAPAMMPGLYQQHQMAFTFGDRDGAGLVDGAHLRQLHFPGYSQVSPGDAAWNTYSTIDNSYTSSLDAISPYHPSWYMPAYTSSVQHLPMEPTWSQPPSSDSRLMQHPPELVEDSTPPLQQSSLGASQDSREGKVLIGLGLYDPPATPPHPFAAASNQGKGLKLEEPWAPPSDPGDEDGEGEEDEEFRDSMTASLALPAESQSVVAQMQKQAQLYKESQWALQPQEGGGDTAVHVQLGMEEQPFLFVGGEDVRDEWWYNPAAGMRAQEQGFGQGWLNA